MLVKAYCNKTQKNSYIDYYESQGLELVSTKRLEDSMLELSFVTDDKYLAASLVSEDTEAFLTFEDGTTSKLHVRRTIDFSD